MSLGVNVLEIRCVLGESVRGVHVRFFLSCHPYDHISFSSSKSFGSLPRSQGSHLYNQIYVSNLWYQTSMVITGRGAKPAWGQKSVVPSIHGGQHSMVPNVHGTKNSWCKRL